MKFSDADSVMQLLVGLNLAYFSFNELREPARARYENAIKELQESVTWTLERGDRTWMTMESLGEVPGKLRAIGSELGWLLMDQDRTTEAFDTFLQRAALIMAMLAFGFLLFSATHGSTELNQILFWVLVALVSLPPALSLLASLTISYSLRSKMKTVFFLYRRYERIEVELREGKKALLKAASNSDKPGAGVD